MTDDTKDFSTAAAQEALASVRAAEKAGLRRGVPSPVFVWAIAGIVGALVAATAARESNLIAPIMAMLAIAVATRRKKAGAALRPFPIRKGRWPAALALMVFAFANVIGGRWLFDAHGLAWAPLAAGSVMFVTLLLLGYSERRSYLQDAEGGQ